MPYGDSTVVNTAGQELVEFLDGVFPREGTGGETRSPDVKWIVYQSNESGRFEISNKISGIALLISGVFWLLIGWLLPVWMGAAVQA